MKKIHSKLTIIFLLALVGCNLSPQMATSTPAATNTSIPSPTVTPSPTPIPKIDAVVKQNSFLFYCSEEGSLVTQPLKVGEKVVLRGKFKEMGIVSEYNGQETECATIPLRDLDVAISAVPELPETELSAVDYGNALEEVTPNNAKYLGEILTIGKGIIQKIVFSPYGKYLAITTPFGVHLYSDSTFEFIRFIKTSPNFIDFSTDGSLLYTVSNASENIKSVHVWDLSDGALKDTIRLATSAIRSFSISPDGKMFITAGDSGVIIWNVENGQLAKKVTGNPEASYAEFSHDGKLIAVGLTGKMQIFEIEGAIKWENEIVYKNKRVTNARAVEDLIFSPDDQEITVMSEGYYAPQNTYQTIDGVELDVYLGSSFAYSPDGRLRAKNGCSAVCIGVLDLTTDQGYILDDLGWPSDPDWIPATGDLTDLAFSYDGKVLASASADGSVQIWDMDSYSLKKKIDGFSKRVVQLDISMDGSNIAYSESDNGDYEDRGGNIILHNVWYDTSTLLPQDLYGFVFDLHYFPSNQYLAASVQSDEWEKTELLTYLLSVDTNEIMETYMSSSYSGGDVSVSSNNSVMITNLGPNANKVVAWEIGNTKNSLAQLGISLPTYIFENAISPDGTILVFEDLINGGDKSEYKIKLYDVLKKKELEAILFPYGTGSFEFLPNSHKMAMVFVNWDGGGEAIQFIDTDTLSVYSNSKLDLGWNHKNIALSPDGRLLALTTWANEIKVFNIDGNIKLLSTLKGHTKEINEIAFSQDGRFLVSGGEDGTIKLWAITP
jgi:WD40 repeat protein